MRFTTKSMLRGVLGALMVVFALAGLTAASALAAGAPTAETKPATAITESSATLGGKVNPNGATTKYYFEYGTTTAYGSKTAEGSTKIETKVSKGIEGLKWNTTYHFRLVATNEFGTSDGADEVFSTPVEPELVLPSGKYTEFGVIAKGATMDLEWSAAKSMACTESSFTGYFLNARELEGTMKWSRCFGEHTVCTNGEEAVKSELLKGTLGYVNKAKKEVGLRLTGKSSEIWANKVSCPGGTWPLTGALGGTLGLQVNTKIHAGGAFMIEYKQEKDKQLTGELGGQLLWEAGVTQFGIRASLEASANKEFEIKA
jgi:hypothetical protein